MDSVVHFEIPADDVKRASAFYKKAFGWDIQKMGDMDYWGLTTTEVNEERMPKSPGAINGGMGARGGPLKVPVVTISVKDIDKTIAAVVKLGGKAVGKKESIGEMGFTAYFKDSEGNTIGLWQPAKA